MLPGGGGATKLKQMDWTTLPAGASQVMDLPSRPPQKLTLGFFSGSTRRSSSWNPEGVPEIGKNTENIKPGIVLVGSSLRTPPAKAEDEPLAHEHSPRSLVEHPLPETSGAGCAVSCCHSGSYPGTHSRGYSSASDPRRTASPNLAGYCSPCRLSRRCRAHAPRRGLLPDSQEVRNSTPPLVHASAWPQGVAQR